MSDFTANAGKDKPPSRSTPSSLMAQFPNWPSKYRDNADLLKANTLPTGGSLGHFVTIRTAKAGEVLRGVTFAPRHDGSGHDEE